MIEMHSKYDNMHINGMFMPYFALIIMFYHVKIACYHVCHGCATHVSCAPSGKIISHILLLDFLLVPCLLHSNSRTLLLKFLSPQSFCEDNRQLIFDLHIFDDNSHVFDVISNEMIACADVLGFIVMS